MACFVSAIFFERITLFREAPAQNDVASWLSLQEDTFGHCTNGQVFADPLGVFSKTRQGFKFMPEDVRLSLISRRLGMMAQAGQYICRACCNVAMVLLRC